MVKAAPPESLTLFEDALATANTIGRASLLEIAGRLSEAIQPWWSHRALIIFTLVCTGRPTKKAGDAQITERVTIDELVVLRDRPDAGHSGARVLANIAGEERFVRTWRSENDALLVLFEGTVNDSELAGSERADSELISEHRGVIERLWQLADTSIQHQVEGSSPDYLAESRVLSAERNRVVQELTDGHTVALEAVLATLRSRHLDDVTARKTATEQITVALRSSRDTAFTNRALSIEPVAGAFSQLRRDLQPFRALGELDLDLVPPPTDGRALPGEVAHVARWLVRTFALSLINEPETTRLRVEWGCDGENLLIKLRDNGEGQRAATDSALAPMIERITALQGNCEVTATAGWGSDLSIRLPLDQRAQTSEIDAHSLLTAREREVLQLVATGARNREIAAKLNVSEHTVKFHVASLLRKFEVEGRAALIARTR